jgi:hypothetical protein
MHEVGAKAAGTMVESYGDAIPAGWTCRQTYLRNHLAMDAALKALALIRPNDTAPLRVLNIGGGVIEPLLLAALVRTCFPRVECSIRVVDSSEDVTSLLGALRNRTRWTREWQGDRLVGYDSAAGSLSLATLAKVFSSPESPVNPHLSDPASLVSPVGELARMNLLGTLALPEDESRAVDYLVNAGFPVAPASVEMLRPEQASILDFDPGKESAYDLIVANFSIQYPIVEGHADAVAARLHRWLAPHGVIQHGATYGAQARLFHALLPLDERFSVTYGVRELDEVTYIDDKAKETLRLRIRTDAIWTRAGENAGNEIAQCIFPMFPGQPDVARGALRDHVAGIHPNDGLEYPRMAGAVAGARQCACWWVDRHVLLRHTGPLPSRVQWRRRAG